MRIAISALFLFAMMMAAPLHAAPISDQKAAAIRLILTDLDKDTATLTQLFTTMEQGLNDLDATTDEPARKALADKVVDAFGAQLDADNEIFDRVEAKLGTLMDLTKDDEDADMPVDIHDKGLKLIKNCLILSDRYAIIAERVDSTPETKASTEAWLARSSKVSSN